MNPTGEVEIVDIPPTYDWNTIVLAQLSAAGIVFQGGGVKGNLGGGLFLYDRKEVLALDTGYVEAFAVSPDGCKAAYGIVNNYGKAQQQEANFIVKFKLIKLCKGE